MREIWSTFNYDLSPYSLPGFSRGQHHGEHWTSIPSRSSDTASRDGKEYTTFALHYEDLDAAEGNASELELRLRTAQLYLYNDSVKVPKGNDESFHYPPLADFCESLQVDAVKYSEFSVLWPNARRLTRIST